MPSSIILRKKSIHTLIGFLLTLTVFSCGKENSLPSEKDILSFDLSGISSQKTTISQDLKQILIEVPYGTQLTGLKPIIKISSGASLVPASNYPQDFSKLVYYTITGIDGTKTVYKVSVVNAPQPKPEILSFDKSIVEAGEKIIVSGKNFGYYPGALKSNLVSSSNVTIPVNTRYLDSSRVEITIPVEVNPNDYFVQLDIGGSIGISKNKITVQYPSPTITKISKKNIIQGDTLLVEGNFLVETYDYKMIFETSNAQYDAPLRKDKKGNWYSIITVGIPPQTYKVNIQNVTTKKNSTGSNFILKLYDAQLPFVQSLVNNKINYQQGETINVNVINFERFVARFYQIQLSNNNNVYFLNGIYNKVKSTLSFDLPTNIKTGEYSMLITLTNQQNQESIIEIDQKITIK